MKRFLLNNKLNLIASVFFLLNFISSLYSLIQNFELWQTTSSTRSIVFSVLEIAIFGAIIVFLILKKRIPIVVLIGIRIILLIVYFFNLFKLVVSSLNNESYWFAKVYIYEIIGNTLILLTFLSIEWTVVLAIKKSRLINRIWFIPAVVYSLNLIISIIRPLIFDRSISSIIGTIGIGVLVAAITVISLIAMGLWNKKYVQDKLTGDKYLELLNNDAITQEEYDLLLTKLH